MAVVSIGSAENEGKISRARPSREASWSVPEQSWVDRWIGAGLLLVSFAYLCIFRRYTAMEPDEGIVLQGAQRILRGDVPYRDFFSFYTPGSYYLQALVFRVLGNSLPIARTVLASMGAICSLITYLLARRVCFRSVSVMLGALATFTALPFRFLVLHNWDSTFWTCLALYCAIRWVENPGWKWAFATGSLVSITTLFEQSKGVGLALGVGFGILLCLRQGLGQRAFNRTQWIFLALGFGWPWVCTFAYFATCSAIPVMVADWLWPLQHYSQANRVPYGYQNWTDASRYALFVAGSPGFRVVKAFVVSPCLWLPAVPLVAVGLLAYWSKRVQAVPSMKQRYYLMITATLCGLLISVVVVRADIIHVMYLQPLTCLVLAWILDGKDIPGRVFQQVRPALSAYIVIALLALGLAPLIGALAARNALVTRRGVLATPEKDTVIAFIQTQVPSGGNILIYPYLPIYYYATDTFSPAGFDYFQPGMNTVGQANEIIRQLASQRTGVLLFESSFAQKIPSSWPGTPWSAIANDPVSDYIARNYRACRVLTSPMRWDFLFMVRKDLTCPGAGL